MQPINNHEFIKLSQLLHEHCGIYLRHDQDYLIETRLTDFVKSLGLNSFSQLIERLQYEPKKLIPPIINLMTTNETLWFRDESCWNALEKKILPELLKKLNYSQEKIKIWVAGCSTGQEAYSLAILIDELCHQIKRPELARQFEILAMDISQSALETARQARYNNFEINRGLSISRRNKYFEQQDSYWCLRPNIRLRVHFDSINLTHNFNHLGRFDLILCRNVTIYFTPQVRSHILSNMIKMLYPGGTLMIGATESLWDDRNRFKMVEFEGCIYAQPLLDLR